MILAAAGGGGGFSMIIILVVMIALMYFMMIRPQSKERKRMNEMLSSMDVGDAILTSSGFYGVVIEIAGEDVIVEFGNNKNCRIPMKKSAIIQVEKPGGYTAPVAEDRKAKKAVEDKAEEIVEKAEDKVETVVEEGKDAAAEAAETIADEVSDMAKEVEKL